MTMPNEPRVVFGSFDAERSWRPSHAATLPTVTDHRAAVAVTRLDEALGALCRPGDLLITGRALPDAAVQVLTAGGLAMTHRAAPGDPRIPVELRIAASADVLDPAARGRRARPYAVTPDAVAACAALGLELDTVDTDLVARVNAKTWSNALVCERGWAGAARLVRSTDELRAATRTGPVVVKDPCGVAGQGTLRVEHPGAAESIARHLERQAARGRRVELLVQRFFDRIADFSAHFMVDRDGRTSLVGLCETINDGFAYRGSRPMGEPLARRLEQLNYVGAATSAAEAVAATGYRGPVCVDSLLTREGTLVPVLEINARVSMGLLTLALARANAAGTAHLRQRTVLTRDGEDATYERLAAALEERGLLAATGRPGILPLAAGPLTAPRGRLVYALYCGTPSREQSGGDDPHSLDTALTGVLRNLAMLPIGDVHAT